MLEEKFKFGIIEKNLGFTKDKDVQGLFHKWDINLQLNYFNFDKVANDIDLPNLLKHLLEDSTVLEKLNVDKYIKKCEVEELSTTVMNMEFLDRFKNPDLQPLICRESGIIVGCSPDIKEGISIDDELRCSLLDQTSLNYDLFDEDEQSEFIFRLFKMIVLGQGARSLINRSNRPWTARAIYQKVDPSVNMKQTSIRT